MTSNGAEGSTAPVCESIANRTSTISFIALPTVDRLNAALVSKDRIGTRVQNVGTLLLAYGIKDEVIAKLVGSKLVTASTECIGGSGRRVEVTRICITDAGQAALKRRD
jgi:hypothetical protein